MIPPKEIWGFCSSPTPANTPKQSKRKKKAITRACQTCAQEICMESRLLLLALKGAQYLTPLGYHLYPSHACTTKVLHPSEIFFIRCDSDFGASYHIYRACERIFYIS